VPAGSEPAGPPPSPAPSREQPVGWEPSHHDAAPPVDREPEPAGDGPSDGSVGPDGEPAEDNGEPITWEPAEIEPVERGRGLALTSLLLGVAALLLSFVFVVGAAAIGTGLVARARSRSRGARGRALATTGAVLGVISLLLGGAIIGLFVHVDQTNRTFTTLRAGDCVDPVGGLLAHYTLTGCDKPHHYETYGVVTALDSSVSPWPGDFGFGLDATQCTPLLLQYVDGPLDRTQFRAVVLLPTEADWDRGVRRIVCAVESSNSKRLVGTVRSSGAGGSSGGTT
jgi:hypothetical protein